MSKIKHLLFDCDGVLIDTEYNAAIYMCKALEEQGVNIDLEHYLKVHSGTTFSAILDHYFGNGMTSEGKLELMHKVEFAVANSVNSINGIPDLLNSLQIDKSVVSNSSIATVKHALKETGLELHFDNRIFSSEQVSNAKPAPDLYLYAIESLAVVPEEILVIEDSRTGTQAAVSAGLNVLGFTGASHILPGHDKDLLEIGAIDTASNTTLLSSKINSFLN